MDIKKLLLDTADQHNCARYQGAAHALENASSYIKTLVMDNEDTREIAVKITKHIVDEINKYNMLINSTDMGKKMNELKEKYETK